MMIVMVMKTMTVIMMMTMMNDDDNDDSDGDDVSDGDNDDDSDDSDGDSNDDNDGNDTDDDDDDGVDIIRYMFIYKFVSYHSIGCAPSELIASPIFWARNHIQQRDKPERCCLVSLERSSCGLFLFQNDFPAGVFQTRAIDLGTCAQTELC